jgi:hypothetical protein
MRLSDLQVLNEDLGNLGKLNVGPLINVLKQSGGSSKRHGDFINPAGTKFATGYGYDIGSTSEIIDVGPLKDGIKSLRRAYKSHDDDARAFAVYIGGTPVMFGTFTAYDLAGRSRSGRLAYDFSAFKEQWDQLQPKDAWRRKEPETTYREKEPYWNQYSSDPKPTQPDRYYGNMVSTEELIGLFDKIAAISKETNQPVTAKLVLSDKAAQAKRRQRYSVRDIESGRDDLMTRLRKYKLSKKPTVNTIEEFIKYAMDNPGKTVQFAGRSYVLKVSSYDKIDPAALLSGKPFDSVYNTADPNSYDSLRLTYMFDPREQTLKPIFAQWYDKSDPSKVSNRQEAVLDGKSYARMKLKMDPSNKAKVIPQLLTMAKNTQWHDLELMVSALRKAGIDWPELDVIEKSLTAEKAKKSLTEDGSQSDDVAMMLKHYLKKKRYSTIPSIVHNSKLRLTDPELSKIIDDGSEGYQKWLDQVTNTSDPEDDHANMQMVMDDLARLIKHGYRSEWMIKWMQDHKREIIRSMLVSFKTTNPTNVDRDYAQVLVPALKKLKLGWPEIDVIEKSMKAGLSR